jgi:hypothetical protein
MLLKEMFEYLWKHDHALVDKLGHNVGLPENVEFLSLQLQLKKYKTYSQF